MKHTVHYLLLLITIISLSACSSVPKMFWDSDDNGGSGEAFRAPLNLPPELTGELNLPAVDEKATLTAAAAPLPEKYDVIVAKAGKKVALNARLYDVTAGQLLSSALDAMTQMNLPVNSVDSPSGIITTDWVRKGDSALSDSILGSIGMSRINVVRYRFIVRVFRLNEGGIHRSRVEVHLLTQAYQNGHWLNKRSLSDRSDELFAAIEEQVARIPPAREAPAEAARSIEP
ncbi:hypothetical protein Ga0123462_2183 [Mariprofundus ferrinatatus]|uniref:Uncharacterized protein n=1 Tax=Mariprofundus ferrinatatus TaxID=1921087 RepID=A0A2K8L6W5_9PROT|nr:hypothetical protein [Mariprofundus ferrinatatus]ATX83017.1 hypothetical protein Ga0123462_2183 [Mariprofundus ferrinatatus]